MSVKEYDENEAIKFINNFLPQDIKGKYSDDDILIVIDTIFDYYESKGFFEIDDDDTDEDDIQMSDLIAFVKKQLLRDSDNTIEPDDVMSIVMGELEYEASLGIYE